MRDEELRRRIEAVAEHGERAVSPPDPAVLYRRARRRPLPGGDRPMMRYGRRPLSG
jgi:hypothetical protein